MKTRRLGERIVHMSNTLKELPDIPAALETGDKR